MHPDKLGGYPDHVNRTPSEAHDPTFLKRSSLTFSSRSSARASRISRSRRLSFFGTTRPTRTMRLPFSAPFFLVLGAPAPLTLNCLPSCVPAGILTLTCLFLRTLPLPPHTVHGFSMILPSPPHLEHGVESAKKPWSRLCTPLPPHSGHVSGAVPGAAPVPLHSPHASSTGTPTRVATPRRASSKLSLTFTVILSPFAL